MSGSKEQYLKWQKQFPVKSVRQLARQKVRTSNFSSLKKGVELAEREAEKWRPAGYCICL